MTTQGDTAGKGQAEDPVAHGWLVRVWTPDSWARRLSLRGLKRLGSLLCQSLVTGCVTPDRSGHFSDLTSSPVKWR